MNGTRFWYEHRRICLLSASFAATSRMWQKLLPHGDKVVSFDDYDLTNADADANCLKSRRSSEDCISGATAAIVKGSREFPLVMVYPTFATFLPRPLGSSDTDSTGPLNRSSRRHLSHLLPPDFSQLALSP